MAGVELRDYQEEAVRRMRNGCILCGGVGSGKSRTSLAYYYVRNGGELGTDEYVPMDDVNIKDLYIITTARKRDTFEWEEELSPFLLSTDKEENLYTPRSDRYNTSPRRGKRYSRHVLPRSLLR